MAPSNPENRPGWLGGLRRSAGLLGEGGWIFTGQAVAAVGSLVGVRLLTGVMTPRAYGELALALTVGTLASQTLYGPISEAAARYYVPAVESGSVRVFLAATRLLFSLATSVVALAAVAVSALLWFLGKTEWSLLCAASVAYSIALALNATIDYLQNAARQRTIVAWHQGLSQWLRILVAFALARALHGSSFGALVGMTLGNFVTLGSQYYFLRRHIHRVLQAPGSPATPGGSRAYAAGMMKWAWPFSTWGVFGWAQSSSDRWALDAFVSTAAVGRYAVLFQLGYTPTYLLSTLATKLLTPVAYAAAGDGSVESRRTRSRRIVHAGALIFAFATVLIALFTWRFSSWIMGLLTGRAFHGDAGLLPVLVLSAGALGCGQIYVAILAAENATSSLIPPKIATAVLAVAANFAGARWYGAAGVVWAGLLSAVAFLVWIAFLVRPRRSPAAAAAGRFVSSHT